MGSRSREAAQTTNDEINNLLGQVDTRSSRVRQRLADSRRNVYQDLQAKRGVLEEKARDALRESFFDTLGASQAQRAGMQEIMNTPLTGHEVYNIYTGTHKYIASKLGAKAESDESAGAGGIENNVPVADEALPDPVRGPVMRGYDGGSSEPLDQAVGGYGDKEEVAEMRNLVSENSRWGGMPEGESVSDISDLTASNRSTGTFGRTADFQDLDYSPGTFSGGTRVSGPPARPSQSLSERATFTEEAAPQGGGARIVPTDSTVEAPTVTSAPAPAPASTAPSEQDLPASNDYDQIKLGDPSTASGGAKEGGTTGDEGMARQMQSDELKDAMAKSDANLDTEEAPEDFKGTMADMDSKGDFKGTMADLPEEVPTAEKAATVGGDLEEAAEGSSFLDAIPGANLIGGIIGAAVAGYEAYEGIKELVSGGDESAAASSAKQKSASYINQAQNVHSGPSDFTPSTVYSQGGRFVAPVSSAASQYY